jgi:hypothetical protein
MHGRFELETWMWASLALGAGPWLFWRGFRDLRLKRLMENTPTARIRSMAMGLVEINGRIAARSGVSAPFSGRPCAYWEVDIAVRSGRRGWSTVHLNQSGHPFYLRDDSGLALVYPHGADCRVNFGVAEECLGLTLPACYAQYMEQEGLGLRHLWRMGAMRFRERILEEGQTLYVLGTALPRARVLAVSDGEAMRATGTDGLRAERVQSLDHEVAATVRQGDNERVFIISEQSERTLATWTGLRATAELAGGPMLALVGLAYWLDKLSKGALFR